MITLKPQDIVVILKTITTYNSNWTYSSLSAELFMSASEAHSSIKRLILAQLWDSSEKKPLKGALEEFVLHGLKYAFPANYYGGVTRGIPTAYAAPPLKDFLLQDNSSSVVWPDASGQEMGFGLYPLYKTVPKATNDDKLLYEALALIDAIRIGRSREKKIAATEFKKRVLKYG